MVDQTRADILVVFIGQDIDRELVTKTLDTALLDDDEWKKWERVNILFWSI